MQGMFARGPWVAIALGLGCAPEAEPEERAVVADTGSPPPTLRDRALAAGVDSLDTVPPASDVFQPIS